MDDKGLYAKAHEQLDRYLETHKDPFTSQEFYRYCGIKDIPDHKTHKDAIDQLLYNLSSVNKKPTLIKDKRYYRKVNYDLPVADWWTAEGKPFPNFKWPKGKDGSNFHFDESITMFCKDLVVIAGEGNEGKSAFALNIVTENMDLHPVTYIPSEYDPDKFKYRMSFFEWAEIMRDGKPKFEVIPMTENYEDVIITRPDNIVILDWITLDDDIYKMKALLKRIQSRLVNGIAVAVIQKRSYKQVGEGGEGTKDYASVYLTIQRQLVTVEKIKFAVNKQLNPNLRWYGFELDNGSQFYNMREVEKCSQCKGSKVFQGKQCGKCKGMGYTDFDIPEEKL